MTNTRPAKRTHLGQAGGYAAPGTPRTTKRMSDITEQVRDALAGRYNRELPRELAEAEARQREIARRNTANRHVDGLGRKVMEVDTKVYQEWCRKEGNDIWKDQAFRKWIGDRHPELKTRQEGTGKVQVGYGS